MDQGSVSAATGTSDLRSPRPSPPRRWPEEPDIERPLGPHEEIYVRADAGQPLNFTASVRLHGELRREWLEAGLYAAQARHPRLRVHLVTVEGRPAFRTGVGHVPIREVEGTPEDALRIEEAEASRRFALSDALPLARLTVVRHADDRASLLFTFHHSIMDGRSAFWVVRDVLRAAALASRGEIAECVSLPQAEAFEDRLPASARGIRGLFGFLAEWLRLQWQLLRNVGRIFRLPLDAPARIDRRGARFARIELDAPKVETLRRYCRDHGATMSALLLAIQTRAMLEAFGAHRPASVVVGTTLDERMRVQPPFGEDCGFFNTGAGGVLRVDPDEPIGPLAARIGTMLARSVERRMGQRLYPFIYRALLGLGRFFARRGRGVAFATFLDALHEPKGVVCTNPGLLALGDLEGPFRVEALAYSVAPSFLNRFGSLAVTLDGTMTWTFTGVTPLVAEERVDRVRARAEAILAELCSTPG